MSGPASPEWPEADVALLRVLWPTALSLSEIGRRCGHSKNAIAAKAGRLGLPRRPSPIKPGPADQAPRRQTRRVPRGASTLPPLASLGTA
jgi:GcrA cell cycle regulator